MLGTLVGSVAGAIGANALEHRHKKHKEEKLHHNSGDGLAYGQAYGGGYGQQGAAVGGLYPGGHHHRHHRHGSRSRSRGLDSGSEGD